MFDRDPGSGIWMPRRLRPIEVFAATHLIGFGAGASVPLVYATWNPSDVGVGVSLSNANHTAAVPANVSARGQAAKSTGKWYVEVNWDSAGSSLIGVGNSSASLAQYPGQNTNSWAFYKTGQKITNNSLTAYGSAYAAGDKVMIALDMTNGRVFFGVNGTWQNSGDPAAGTNAAFTGLTGSLMVMGGSDSGTINLTGNWGDSAFTYTVPSGFSGWTNP